MDILSLTHKTKELIEDCEAIYGERWKGIRTAVREKELKPHHEEKKTESLLSSAIAICTEEEDPKVQMILLAAAFGDDN